MNKRRVLILAAALLVGLVLVTGALAQGTPAVDWWVVGGGGGESSGGGGVVVNSTLGQPIIGPSGGTTSLGAGYWYGAEGPPTVVTLSAFTAAWDGGVVLVAWETAMEIDTLSFNVWRSTAADGAYTQVNEALIPSASPGGVWGGAYAYVDFDVIPGVTYYYKLEELEVGGARNWYGPVSTDDDNPTSVILFQAAAGRPGFAALAWWLAGAAAVVGASWVLARLVRRCR